MTETLTHAEMKAVLASIYEVDADAIDSWIVAAKVRGKCAGENCDNDCLTTALISSGSSLEYGHNEPFMLHMAAEIIEAIAQHQNERDPS